MTSYRIFTMGRERQTVRPPTDFDAATDEDAVRHARTLLDGHDLELWQRGRFITRLRGNTAAKLLAQYLRSSPETADDQAGDPNRSEAASQAPPGEGRTMPGWTAGAP